jgi:hypothetical protein
LKRVKLNLLKLKKLKKRGTKTDVHIQGTEKKD